MKDDHTVSGSVEDKPTAEMVCRVRDEVRKYRVFDPSDFVYCPICGELL